MNVATWKQSFNDRSYMTLLCHSLPSPYDQVSKTLCNVSVLAVRTLCFRPGASINDSTT